MLRNILSAAAIGAGMLMIPISGASAAIVCQGHTCWHTQEAYDFPHRAGVVVHEDIGAGARAKGFPSVSTRVAATGAAAAG